MALALIENKDLLPFTAAHLHFLFLFGVLTNLSLRIFAKKMGALFHDLEQLRCEALQEQVGLGSALENLQDGSIVAVNHFPHYVKEMVEALHPWRQKLLLIFEPGFHICIRFII